MPLPSSTQISPGYPQATEQGSFSQRFPTPEHYLQQLGQHQVHQRKPQVHYVAEANNPFSDQFQELHNKGRGRGGAKKKSGPKKPGKSRSKKTEDVPPPEVDLLQQHHQSNPTLPEQSPQWTGPTPCQQAQAIKQERLESEGGVPQTPEVQQSAGHTGSTDAVTDGSLDGGKENESALAQEVKEQVSTEKPEQYTEDNSLVATSENSSCNAPSAGDGENDTSLSNKEMSTTETETPAPAEQDANEPADKGKRPCNGTGLEALQKLESMVADMANEEEACKELEKQSELERMQLQLDDDVYDPEMDKIYERDFIEEPQFEQCLLSPVKTVGNGSQANSVASLECHEESLISPLLEETERRKERQTFFAETASSDTVVAEKKTADVAKPEAKKEQPVEEEMLSNALDSSEPTACNVANTSGDENVDRILSNAHPSADQPKVVEESAPEVLTDSGKDAAQDIEPRGTDENHTPREHTDDLSVVQAQNKYNDSFANQIIETTATELTSSSCETMESVISPVTTTSAFPAINDIAAVVSSNGEMPLASDGEQRPMEEQINCSAPGNNCESLPHHDTANIASVIDPEAVHETVSQIPKPLGHFQSIQMQEHVPANPARPAQREKTAKTPKQSSRPRNQHSTGEGSVKKRPPPKEEDPMKKQLQELRRQEYERKKREYEEQQKKKRELQKELRIQKQMIREQRKRQRIYMNANSRSKKTEVENDDATSLKISTPNNTHRDLKPATPLSLCEPKLLLTHALTHPYGSRPFNGQCLLKGNFGSAKVDGMVDYYAQFPTADMDIVVGHPPTPPSSLPPSPGIHQHRTDSSGKPLVNGDVSPEQHERAELLPLSKPPVGSQDAEHPAKRARYTGALESSKGGVSVPPSMPTPPLSDSAAAVSDRLVEIISSGRQPPSEHAEANGKESNTSSSSASPETVQYIASSSPESDALNRVQTPQFSALLHRDSTDSPTFPAVTIKREQVEHYLDNGVSCSQSCSNFSDNSYVQTTCKLEVHHSSRLENDTDDLDSINVTLTLSPTSEQRVTDTVASVADLIGCSPPRHSDIVIEPSGKGFATKGFMATQSLTTPVGDNLSSSMAPRPHTSSDIYQKKPFSCSQLSLSPSEETPSRKKPEGPYCRHCDVLIIGIGVKRKPEDETVKTTVTVESNQTQSDAAEYKIYGVNVEAGDCTGDIFCSEACLKQYFAHFGSACSSPTRECKPDINATQPRLDATVTSVGQTSAGTGNVTKVSDVDTRGSLVADGLPPTSLRKIRSPSWKQEDEDEEVG